jgi:Na+-translocating ferredoxin:NAD+ oxidoreductase RnfE subunit
MAVTTSGTNGLGMGLATTAVLVVSNVLVSMIRHTVSSQVRIPVFVVLIATLVTVVDMAMNAWLHDLYKVLGLFIALIVVNCAILGRAEAFAVKNGVAARRWMGWRWGWASPARSPWWGCCGSSSAPARCSPRHPTCSDHRLPFLK